jgi:hypothetical protein
MGIAGNLNDGAAPTAPVGVLLAK